MIESVPSIASSPAPFPPAGRAERPLSLRLGQASGAPGKAPRLDADESRRFEIALRASLDGRRPLGPVMMEAIAGGNRLRPLMVREAFLAAGVAGGGAAGAAAARGAARDASSDDAWIAPAVAVELVHSASLAHDDLPDFDDETERRGRPALHVRAGVPAAILGGDALLASAFAVVARGLPAAAIAPSVDLLARSVTVMCRGQQQDLSATEPFARRRANARKSGVLFAISGALGVLAAGRPTDDPLVRRMIGLGMRLGTTYQAVDDVRDGEGDAAMAALQFRALDRRLATLPPMPRVVAMVELFSAAAG